MGVSGSTQMARIFNLSTGVWKSDARSAASTRFSPAVASVGSVIAFAGGGLDMFVNNGVYSIPNNYVAIYNASSDAWTLNTTLSVGRTGIAAAGVGDVLVFAGGRKSQSNQLNSLEDSAVVDIYDTTSGTWKTSSPLTVARDKPAVAVVGGGALTNMHTHMHTSTRTHTCTHPHAHTCMNTHAQHGTITASTLHTFCSVLSKRNY